MIRRLAFLFVLLGLPGAAAGAEGRDPYTHFFHPLTGDLKAEYPTRSPQAGRRFS